MSEDTSWKPRFQDLKELHIAIFTCRRCQEKGKRVTNIQPPWDPERGRRHAPKWGMWIGQAPGAKETTRGKKAKVLQTKAKKAPQQDETHRGIAFAGDAGQRFRRWLLDAGFSEEEIRTQLYKTAVIKCYPGQRGGVDRPPGRTEIELCRSFLEEQIRLIEPKVLIPMGVLALHWFFPNLRLEEAVGNRLIWRGRDVVCFPHASRASNWWKQNEELLTKAKNRLRELREEMMPVNGGESHVDH